MKVVTILNMALAMNELARGARIRKKSHRWNGFAED
jgi:hypothetical protein